uniref:Uncharacterized protein n=1 Tax=Pongo abelii TaxID=9601 RepID=A0A8I5THU5_PONAB
MSSFHCKKVAAVFKSSLQMLIFFFGPGCQTNRTNRKQNYFSSWRAEQQHSPVAQYLDPQREWGAPGQREAAPALPATSGLNFPHTSRPLGRWPSLDPTPLPTHCFSCASRSLTSASRLFTRATSSSSRSCSRRFWASVFCQSAEDGRLVTHRQGLRTPGPPPSPSRLFQFPYTSQQTTL